jgi:hypothetical protein
MKAEWDEAPSRLKGKKWRIPPFKVSLFAAVLVFGVTDYLAKEHGWMYGWIKKAFPSKVTTERTTTTTVEISDAENLPTAEEFFWQNIEQERAAKELGQPPQQARQTVFNDNNYKPRTDINTMESRQIAVASYNKAPPPQARRESSSQINGTSNVTLKWRDARGRESQWPTTYSYRNSQIDNGSFCRNYGSGSIDYRTCRKAAKEWLNEQCGNGNRVQGDWQRMYCLANNGFRI